MVDIYTMLDGTVYFNFMNDSSYVVMKHVNVKREEYTIQRVSLCSIFHVELPVVLCLRQPTLPPCLVNQLQDNNPSTRFLVPQTARLLICPQGPNHTRLAQTSTRSHLYPLTRQTRSLKGATMKTSQAQYSIWKTGLDVCTPVSS
jgi:hypothetical protein